ncbi:hypothetical protein AAFG07_25945 [Bradyrhizobium sp. B097]|uniref:hypothetical protein n=1 Tax=Bradyrhizobium sp. B097 TaxID=3140244 RepID=UPI0031841CAD
MGTFYTDEQIQETIAALESYSPGIWEIMKKMALVEDPLADEHAREQTAILRALAVVLPDMPFLAQAENKPDAENRLLIDVRKVIRAEIDAAKSGS